MSNKIDKSSLDFIQDKFFEYNCTSEYCEQCENKEICDKVDALFKLIKKNY